MSISKTVEGICFTIILLSNIALFFTSCTWNGGPYSPLGAFEESGLFLIISLFIWIMVIFTSKLIIPWASPILSILITTVILFVVFGYHDSRNMGFIQTNRRINAIADFIIHDPESAKICKFAISKNHSNEEYLPNVVHMFYSCSYDQYLDEKIKYESIVNRGNKTVYNNEEHKNDWNNAKVEFENWFDTHTYDPKNPSVRPPVERVLYFWIDGTRGDVFIN